MRDHPDFAALADHLAGREDAAVAAHLKGCAACAQAAAAVARLLAAGRRAASAPLPSRRALRLALKAFRAPKAPSLLELVFDSFRKPATAQAIRAGALETRFLRFSGEATVEIEVREGARGTEIRGQVTPKEYAPEVTLVAGKVRRRAKVAPDGTFVLRSVPRGAAEIRLGGARIELEP
jgi:anti-sigma factor RsiW